MRAGLAELLGTFALVFAGTGAIIINDVTGGGVSHVGVGLTLGLIRGQGKRNHRRNRDRRGCGSGSLVRNEN